MASQSKVIGIVAWVLVVVLLLGAGALAFLNSQQSGRVAGLQDALLQVGTTAGVEGLAPEAVKDAAKLPDLLQQVQTAIQAKQQELVGAKEALAVAQTEASDAKTEVATLSQSVKDQTAKAETLASDLTAKDAALAEAKAAAEQAALEVKDAQAAAEKQKAELERSLASLQAQMAEESARLQAELEAARQPQAQIPEAAPVEVSQSPAGEMPLEIMAENPGSQPEPPVEVQEAMPESTMEEEGGQVIGQSQMFSLIRYSEVSQTLSLRLLDGQNLRYKEVPLDVYSELMGSTEKLDVNYRFKIQGAYKSVPPDSIVVRKFWKWKRRHPAKGDVRVIDPELVPVAEAAPVAAPVEEIATETAVAAPAETAPAGE